MRNFIHTAEHDANIFMERYCYEITEAHNETATEHPRH
jgi:hypothetical protein